MEYINKNLRCSRCIIEAGLEEKFDITPPDEPPFAVTIYEGSALCWYCLIDTSVLLKQHFNNPDDDK